MDRSRSFPYKGESHKLLSNLVKSLKEILATERVAKTFERPPRLPGPNWSKDKIRYCHFHKDYGHETNKCEELKHQIEEAVKTGQLTHLVKEVTKKREKTSDTQSGEKKKEEKPALEKTSILMVSGRDHSLKKRPASDNRTREITFPHPKRGLIRPNSNQGVHIRNTSKQGIFGQRKFMRKESWPLGEVPLEVTIGEGPLTITKTLTFVIVRSDSPHNLLLGRTAMQEIGIVVSTVHGAIKFHTPNGVCTIFSEHNSHSLIEEEGNSTNNGQGDAKDILRVLRTLIIGEGTFNTEHHLNVFNHTEPVKQKKRSLAPERNEVVRTQVEELVEAGVLREVKYQTWVSNPIIVKKDDGK
ncbi:hypothetical protein Tco_0906933 [Tanacetum coccineum]|uniref:Reverse transcriptase domain-containing protein n=1 Tax=Tanacetum coccineum TaxID=301880 RepID=A0ABQ5CK64_9ASTR